LVITIFIVAYSQWGFFGAFLFLAVMTQLEFYELIKANGIIPLRVYGTCMGILIYTLFFLGAAGYITDTDWFYIILPLTSGVYFIKLYKKGEKKPFTNIAFTFLGIFYVALPISCLSVAAFSFGHYSYQIIIGLFLILWASDTGAYFAGIQFGKRKLFERVSPKKSWEGSVGGAILSLISLITIVCGTYGDLVESLFKRSMQIKDSGKKLPGHGGFLDRFDGLLLSVPFIVIFLKFCAR